MSHRGHRAVAHTADVIVEAWGPDLAACCEEAVAGLVDVYLDTIDPDAPAERQRVVIGPGGPDELLVALLDEVIFVVDTSPLVPTGATVRLVEGRRLDVELTMIDPTAVEPAGSVPKAISRSGLGLDHDPDGTVRCSVLVDV